MDTMFSFFLWWMTEVPNFLLSEPIKYFTGIFIGLACVGLFRKLLRI